MRPTSPAAPRPGSSSNAPSGRTSSSRATPPPAARAPASRHRPPGGSRPGFGALLLGVHDIPGGKLRYAGKVGTGFDEHLLDVLTRRLAKLKRPDSPLANAPREKGIEWVRPQLVCEVAFAERTDDGILRQASFMGLREDIPAKSVSEERAQKPPEEQTPSRAEGARRPLDRAPEKSGNVVHGTKITHPERIVYPALNFTKL